MNSEPTNHRRNFLAGMFGAAAAAGLSIAGARTAAAEDSSGDAWIKEVKGTHRCLFDFPNHKNGFPLLHILNYLNTYSTAYKTSPGQVGAVGTFYSAGSQASIPLAFNDSLWAKYKFGEFAKINDPATKQPAVRNIYMHSKPGDLMLPGMAIEKLQARGVRFVVCNVALTLLSGMMGKSAGLTPEAAKKEWTAAMHPGFMIVPSGVLAVNRAQEAGCKYCSAG